MATFMVTTLVDEDNGYGGQGLSLREAIKFAMATPGTDRIVFDPNIGGLGLVAENHRGVGAVDLPDRPFASIVRIEAGESFASAMAGRPAGTLYIVGTGIHRAQEVVPRNGDAFIGEPGAIMNGALPLKDPVSFDGNGNPIFDLPKPLPLADVRFSGEGDPSLGAGHKFGENPGEAIAAGRNPTSITGYPEQLFFTPPSPEPAPFVPSAGIAVRSADATDGFQWFLDYQNQRVVIDQVLYNYLSSRRFGFELGVAKFAFGYDASSYEKFNPSENPLGQPIPESPSDVAEYLPNPYSGVSIYSDRHPYADKPHDVIIQNLTIEHYANPAQTGAIGYNRPGLDWLVENNEVRWNNGTGVELRGDHAIVRDNFVHHNGQFGIAAGDGDRARTSTPDGDSSRKVGNLEETGFYYGYAGAGGLIENNEVAFNRLPEIGVNQGWGAGGMKLSRTFNIRVTDNWVHDNDGRGIWLDFAYGGSVIEGNRVEGNSLDGIFVEITAGPTVVANNELERDGWLEAELNPFGSQILVVSSRQTEVVGNTVRIYDEASDPNKPISTIYNARGTGIVIRDDGTRNVEEYSIFSEGNAVHDNIFYIEGPESLGQNENGRLWSGAYFEPNDLSKYPDLNNLGLASIHELYDRSKNWFF